MRLYCVVQVPISFKSIDEMSLNLYDIFVRADSLDVFFISPTVLPRILYTF